MPLVARSMLFLMSFILLALSLGTRLAVAQANKDGNDDVVGARWEYEIHKVKDSDKSEKGLFRVKDKVIYRGNKKVGVIHAQSRTETTLIIDGLPELNGRATLTKVDEKPPAWRGHLVRKDGTKWRMKVEMKDR